jgi:hypothetical protein
MTKERTDATEAFYQAWVPSTTHIITFDHQLDKQQKKCKTINVIILDEAKTLHFVGQMYKSDYITKYQMTKYKIKANINKTWLHTLQFFTKLFAQHKAYGDDRAANSSFNSAAHINNIPTDCSLVSTSSDSPPATSPLRASRLEESLAAARNYIPKECAPTLDKPDPANLLRIELDAQQKQFELVMQQNSALLEAMANGNGGGGGGGGGGGHGGGIGGGSKKHRDRGTKAIFPNCNKLVVHAASGCYTLPANKDKIPTWYKPPKLD